MTTRLLLLSLCLLPALQSAEVRLLPWRLNYHDKQAQIVDGYLTVEGPADAVIALVLPGQQRVQLPYRPTYETFQAGGPLVGAVAWQDGTRIQIHVRTVSEDWLRQLQVDVRNARGAVLWRGGWSAAPTGTVLQFKRWQSKLWAYQIGAVNKDGVLAGSYATQPISETDFLVPGALPFRWNTQHALTGSPSGTSVLDDSVVVHLPVDTNRLAWSVLSQAGFYPRQTWDLGLIANPTWRRELCLALGTEPSLGTLYRSLSALGPATQWVMLASPEALSWWEKNTKTQEIRRQLLAGSWLAIGYQGLPRSGTQTDKVEWDRIVSGLITQSNQALQDVMRGLGGFNPATLLPVSMGRQGEIYYVTFLQLSDPAAAPFLWVDFWAPEQYKPQQPEETVELRFSGHHFIDALENLPWFGPSS